MKHVHVKTRNAWRQWLTRNHGSSPGVWLVFCKKHTGRAAPEYEEAVEEALCFGWIDSIIRKLDGDRHARKFTPRKRTSRWSPSNKARVERLIKQGRMTESGLARIAEAKASGLWDKTDRPQISLEVPEELKKALSRNKKAAAFFAGLAPTYRKQFIGWVVTAKRQDTKDRRVRESIALLEKGEKLGLR